MRNLSGVYVEMTGKFWETIKIIQSANMPLLDVFQSTRGKIVFFNYFRFTIKKLFQFNWNFSSKCGGRMVEKIC